MAALSLNTYRLADVEARAAAFATFRIPRKTLRNKLRPGYYAKVVMESDGPEPRGERVWVIVTAILGPGRYSGRLESEPVTFALHVGQVVEFEARHVADVQSP